jgi:hypothetical protein
MSKNRHSTYRSTESKYKGTAAEMYVVYDLDRRTLRGDSTPIPKIKRVYIAGDVDGWNVGEFRKRSGREAHGVRIEYQQTRRAYRRGGYRGRRGQAESEVGPASVRATTQHFAQVVEVPPRARNVRFYTDGKKLPEVYRHALQRVR